MGNSNTDTQMTVIRSEVAHSPSDVHPDTAAFLKELGVIGGILNVNPKILDGLAHNIQKAQDSMASVQQVPNARGSAPSLG